jgi:hypothetical protein
MTILAAWTPWESIMLAGGALLICFVMMRLSRQRRSQAGQGQPMSPRDRIKQESGVHERVDDMMVQLAELARSTTAQIETRYTKLEVLLEDADKTIARLESLLSAAGSAPAASNSARPETIRPEHARIHALADSGKSAVQIAQEVGRDVGEVELILALRRKNP